MVASYYIIKPIYCLIWHILKPFRTKPVAILYCDDAFDVTLFKNVQKHLAPIPIVAKNRSVALALKKAGYTCSTLPAFPDAVIMFRNMAWKFPCKRIITVGFEHGAYNFKKFSNSRYYNMFTVFFMTSSHDVERIHKLGVTTVKAIGYPKIDSAFDGSISPADIHRLSTSINIDPTKKTLLFSATWDGSGMSAVDKWYNHLSELTAMFNILATLHPWVSAQYRETLKYTQGVYFIEDNEMLPYIMLADVCIGDTNSLIAEFCLLNKPIITFRVPPTPRTMPDVIALIEHISLRINTFDELSGALKMVLQKDDTDSLERQNAVKLFFDKPDGCAGKRAAEEIVGLLPGLRKTEQ